MLNKYLSNDDVKVSSYNGMNIIKYKHLGVDWANPDNLLARGLILDDDGNIIARPFSKFFNLNELVGREDYDEGAQRLSKADQGPIEVTDKLDGSLVIVFYHNGLRFASSGSLEGHHVSLFEDAAKDLWSDDTFDKVEELAKDYTLMFEYTSPNNKIVLNYDKDQLRLIGINSTVLGKSYTMKEVKELTKDFGLEYVKTLPFNNLDEVLDYTNISKDIEGAVILFTDTMKRVKIKTEEYFTKHREVSLLGLRTDGLTKKHIKYIEHQVLQDNKGHLDDLLSRYRGIEVFNETLREADDLIEVLEEYYKQLETLALGYNSYHNQVKDFTYVDIMCSDLLLYVNDVGLPADLVVLVSLDLDKFHRLQDDYILINETIRSTGYSKLIPLIDSELGLVSNYKHKITPKSYIFNVLDYVLLWNKLKKVRKL